MTEQPDPALTMAAADPDSESGPLRRCFVSGERRPVETMIRFVVGPGEEIVADLAGRLPGRGLWLSAGRDMIETAAAKRLFSKAARRSVIVPDGLSDLVAAGLKRRCLDRLGLARRAGLVAVGFEQVRAEAKAGRVAVVLEAAEGSLEGRRKITALAPTAPVVDLFSGADLGAALGRDRTVHASLAPGGVTDALVREVERYRGFAP